MKIIASLFYNRFPLLILLLFFANATGQEWEPSATAEIRLQGGTQEKLPFWFYSNTNGRHSENTHFSSLLNGNITRKFYSAGSLTFGGALLYRNGTEEDFVIDEAFAHYENSWMQITAGIRPREDLYAGLSASNENILWSNNFRSMPGLQFGTSSPLYFKGDTGLGVEMFWGDYYAGSSKHLSQVKMHRKSLHFVFNSENGWFLKGGLLHFVQWGGTDPLAQESVFDFQAYFRAISGRQSSTPNNHLGSWQGMLRRDLKNFSVEIFADLPFESGTGAKLGNFPDGRYGIFWKKKEPEYLLNSLLYEFYTTRAQGADDYLNHPYYRDGWSYKQNVLATPFFTFSAVEGGITNNDFTVHHIGVGGDFGNYYDPYPYRLLMSFGKNYGTPNDPNRLTNSFFSGYFTTRLYNNKFTLDLHLASDFYSQNSPNHAAGITLKYHIFPQQTR